MQSRYLHYLQNILIFKQYLILILKSFISLITHVPFSKEIFFSIEKLFLYGKDNFADVSKNVVRYRFENNFVGPLHKIIMFRTLNLLELKLFATSLIMLEIPM